MPRREGPASAPGALPAGYRQVLSWRVTEKPGRFIAMQLLGVLCLLIFGAVFAGLAVSIGNLPRQMRFGLGETGLAFVGVIATFALHELTHGVFMRMLGAAPRFGAMWKRLMLYTTSPGFFFRRNDYALITLAPLGLLSALVVLGMALAQGTAWVALLALCGAVNASGAIGDMWITLIVLRYPRTAYVMDERDGIRVYAPEPGGDQSSAPIILV